MKRIVRPLNLRRQRRDKRDFLLSDKRVKLPEVLDLSPNMSPVKDQLELGSCVAFAACAIKEWHENVENIFEKKKKKDKKDFSEQWVYYECKHIDPWPNEEGTDTRSAMKVLHRKGVPVESGWPYNDKVPGRPRKWAAMVALWNRIGSYEAIYSLKELKLALHLHGPVIGGVVVFDGFYEPPRGRIPMPTAGEMDLGYHAICIVGYNEKKKEIKFKNSWGLNWGKRGYGWISYDYANSFLFDVWCPKDISVTRLSPYN